MAFQEPMNAEVAKYRQQSVSAVQNGRMTTRDLNMAAYLQTRGARLIGMQDDSTIKPRAYFTFEHPALRQIVHEFYEPLRICPNELFQNRIALKRHFHFPTTP